MDKKIKNILNQYKKVSERVNVADASKQWEVILSKITVEENPANLKKISIMNLIKSKYLFPLTGVVLLLLVAPKAIATVDEWVIDQRYGLNGECAVVSLTNFYGEQYNFATICKEEDKSLESTIQDYITMWKDEIEKVGNRCNSVGLEPSEDSIVLENEGSILYFNKENNFFTLDDADGSRYQWHVLNSEGFEFEEYQQEYERVSERISVGQYQTTQDFSCLGDIIDDQGTRMYQDQDGNKHYFYENGNYKVMDRDGNVTVETR